MIVAEGPEHGDGVVIEDAGLVLVAEAVVEVSLPLAFNELEGIALLVR